MSQSFSGYLAACQIWLLWITQSLIGLPHVLNKFSPDDTSGPVSYVTGAGVKILYADGDCWWIPSWGAGAGLWVLRMWKLFLICQVTLGTDILHCHRPSALDKSPMKVWLVALPPPLGLTQPGSVVSCIRGLVRVWPGPNYCFELWPCKGLSLQFGTRQ